MASVLRFKAILVGEETAKRNSITHDQVQLMVKSVCFLHQLIDKYTFTAIANDRLIFDTLTATTKIYDIITNDTWCRHVTDSLIKSLNKQQLILFFISSLIYRPSVILNDVSKEHYQHF